MLREMVEVIDRMDNKVKVKFTRKPMCSCCKFGSLCGMGETELIMDALGFSLEKGDKIEVGIEEKKSLIASLITFLFPVVIFISVLLFLKEQGELFSFILAILAVMFYYLTIRVLTKSKKEYFNLKVLRKL